MLGEVKLGATGRNDPGPLDPVSYQFAEQPLARLNIYRATCLVLLCTFPVAQVSMEGNTLLLLLIAPHAQETKVDVVNLKA